MAEYKTPVVIQGEGGGGKGGGSSRVAQEDPNTLRSKNVATVLDLLGEGPIYGLVNGLQSVFLDGVPVENSDGSYNYNGLTLMTRQGYPDQSAIPGIDGVYTEYGVNKEVRNDAPIVEGFTNAEADVINVKVQVQALTYQDKKSGDLKGSTVQFAVDVRDSESSAWVTKVSKTLKGKTTSPYQTQFKIRLPAGGPNWQVRVRRITPDDQGANYSNDLYFVSMTSIIEAKLTYPNSVLIGFRADASQFGTSIPERSYLVRGMIINVPSNYDPITREYTGTWNGTFKKAWTDNPAWILYDMVTNTRYGAGQTQFYKWDLYAIGQYCDELVPDGYGGMEPRFTCNVVITAQEDAYAAIDSIASIFRGMVYWSSSEITAVADRPGTPKRTFTRANIIDDFVRQGTSMKARHSVVLVTWNDPEDQYKKTIEMVTDQEMIKKWGWRQTEVTQVGCTSRGQARRAGKWIMYSEKWETETISYAATSDAMDLRPGDLIQISDPAVSGIRLGGRLLEVGTNTVTLDRIDDLDINQDWQITVSMPNGGSETRAIASFSGTEVTLENPLPEVPVKGAVWTLSSSEVYPELFKIISLSDPGVELQPKITAVSHNPGKYALVEEDVPLPDRPVSVFPTGSLKVPSQLNAVAHTYLEGEKKAQAVTVSWTASDDVRVVSYRLEAIAPGETSWEEVYAGSGVSHTIKNAEAGEWNFRVRAVGPAGSASSWVYLDKDVQNFLLPIPPDSVNFEIGTLKVTIKPVGDTAAQLWEVRRSDVALELQAVESNSNLVGIGTTLVDVELEPLTTYYYYVRGINNLGESEWYASQIETKGDPQTYLDMLSKHIGLSELTEELATEIGRISGDGEGSVSSAISQRIQELRGELEQQDTALQEAIDSVSASLNSTSSNLGSRVDNLEADTQEVSDRLTSEAERLDQAVQAISDEADQARQALDSVDADLLERVKSADQAIVSETEARENDYESLAQAINALVVGSEDSQARIRAIERVTSEAGELEAIQFTAIEAVSSAAKASIRTEETARTNADEALAQITTNLNSRVGAAEADILTVDQARVDGDSVLSSRIGELTAQLAAAPQFYSSFEAGTDYFQWNTDSGSTLSAVTDDSFEGEQCALIQSTATNPNPGSDTNTAYAPIPTGAGDSFSGYEVKVTLSIKKPSSDAAAEMAVAYSTNSVGNSGWRRFTPTDVWQTVEFTYAVPESAAGNTHYVGIWGDTSGQGGGVLVDNVRLRRADAEVSEVSAAIQDEQSARVAADAALSSQVTGLRADYDNVSAALNTEQQTRANADRAMASDITSLQSELNTAKSNITTEQQARASADAALATRASDIETRVGNAESRITDEEEARTDADQALTNNLNSAVSRIGDAESAITSEAQTRANADNALSSSLQGLTSRVGDAESDIVSEAQTRANADNALSQRASSLETRVGDAESAITTETQARTSAVSAVAQDLQQLEARLDDSGGTIIDEAKVRADEDEALAAAISGLNAGLGGAQASVSALRRAQAESDAVAAIQFEAMEATRASASASIRYEEQVRVEDDTALASRASSVEARMGAAESRITTEEQVRSSADQSLASDITDLSANLLNSFASLRDQMHSEVNGLSLVDNGSFVTGDDTDWEYIGGGDTRYLTRDFGGDNPLTDDAPAANFIVIGENNYGNATYLQSEKKPVQPGEQVDMSFWFCRVNWANGSIRPHLQVYDAGGNSMSWIIQEQIDLVDYGNKEWQKSNVWTFTIPEGAYYARVNIVLTNANTQGGLGVTAIHCGVVSSSLAQRITTAEATLGNDIASVQQQATATINQVNDKVTEIGALWTAKVQANGLIGSFGVYNNGQEVQAGFDVDLFSIGRSSSDKTYPFIVSGDRVVMKEALIDKVSFNKLTDSSGTFIVQNGKLKAEYIQADSLQVKWANVTEISVKSGNIENGAITSAKIGDAEVGTLKLAGNAVTVPGSVFTGGEKWAKANIGGDNWTEVQRIVYNAEGSAVQFLACFSLRSVNGALNGWVRFRKDGQTFYSSRVYDANYLFFTHMRTLWPGNGNHTYTVDIGPYSTNNSADMVAGNRYIGLMGVKR